MVLETFDKTIQNNYSKIVGNLLKLYETIESNKNEANPDVKSEFLIDISFRSVLFL